MINIIPTLTVMDTLEEYEVMVNNFIASNSSVFRCNATRFSNEIYVESINTLQDIYFQKTGKNFKLLLDIPCPKDKQRIEFKRKVNQFSVKKGEKIRIVTQKDKMKDSDIYIDISESKFYKGQEIIIGDGDAVLTINDKHEGYIECISKCNGEIGYRKACYMEGNYCHIINEDKYNNYLSLIEMLSPEYVALSFVEYLEEIEVFLKNIKTIANGVKIISKIESKKAINNLNEIISLSNGILIGRGDLALSSGYSNLPILQEQIIQISKEYRCEVYVATEILNSLCNKAIPSRSEICDIYYLMKSGINNLVLSGPLCRYNQYNIAADYIRKMEKLVSPTDPY